MQNILLVMLFAVEGNVTALRVQFWPETNELCSRMETTLGHFTLIGQLTMLHA
jgi:hypothetical protein